MPAAELRVARSRCQWANAAAQALWLAEGASNPLPQIVSLAVTLNVTCEGE
jgi:hypothetical protein